MRYRFRYNIGPLYADNPFRRPGPDRGVLAAILGAVWMAVAFVLQLLFWAVLLVVGLIYTVIWLIVWPFSRLSAR